MPVAFNYTPSNERVPLFTAEVNAGTPPYSGISRTLLVGRKLTGGSAATGVPINIGNSDPVGLFGAGSMLADMAVYARFFNSEGAIYALPLADPTGSPGTATGSLSFTGPATAAGTFTRYIAGEAYSVGVAPGDTATTIAAAFTAVVNAGYTKFQRQMLPPVSAAIDGDDAFQVNFTARHSGPEGNGTRIEAGLVGNEIDPPGVTAAITAMSGGTGTISMAAALALLGNEQYDWIIAGPYNTAQNLTDADTFLANNGSGRWSPTVGLFGHYICCFDGNLAAQTSLGAGRNGPHVTILATNQYPHPPWVWGAALGGIVGFSKNLGAPLTEAVEIARPLQSLPLTGLRRPAAGVPTWGRADRQALYTSGMSAVTFGPDGTPQIDRLCTTYQVNPWGARDLTFLDLETMASTQYAIQYLRNLIVTTYPRHVLKDENPGNLQGVVTPAQARATLIHGYTDLDVRGGVVENHALFAQYLIVERSTDPSRMNAYLPMQAAGALRVFAANATMFAELSSAVGSSLAA